MPWVLPLFLALLATEWISPPFLSKNFIFKPPNSGVSSITMGSKLSLASSYKSILSPLLKVSTLAGEPFDLPFNLKNVGFTPVKTKQNPPMQLQHHLLFGQEIF